MTNYFDGVWAMGGKDMAAAAALVRPLGAVTAELVRVLLASASKAGEVSAEGDASALKTEDEKQELQMRMAERLAKVLQELAIAQRIEVAEEVEIEEFLDHSGEGNVGAKVGDDNLTLGLQGKGSRVVRRVIRFKGRSMDAGAPGVGKDKK
ncbi:MAG: hypothetical protein ACYCX3_15805 [Thermoleophilia bacterium]